MNKSELKIGDLYADENIKIQNKSIVWKIIEVGSNYLLLESNELFWGRPFNFSTWEDSQLRTWLYNNITGIETFQPQTVTINGQQISEQVIIKELGNTGDRYNNEFQKFYCRPIVKVSTDGYVHQSGLVYNVVPKMFFPTIEIPYDLPINENSKVHGLRKVKFKFTNPAGSAKVQITIKTVATQKTLLDVSVDGYTGEYIWNIDSNVLNNVSYLGMSCQAKIKDSLGSIGTCDFDLASTDSILGFTDIWNDKIEASENPTFNFTPKYDSGTIVLQLIVNGNIEITKNNPTQAKQSLKLDDSKWKALSDGVNEFKIKMTSTTGNRTCVIKYTVMKKTPKLQISCNPNGDLGRCITAPNIAVTCMTNLSGQTHTFAMKVDNRLLRTETFTSNTYYNCTINSDEWNSLSYGKHKITFNAFVEGSDASTEVEITFIKGTGTLEVFTSPITLSKPAKSILVYADYKLEKNATIKVYAKTNGNNSSWEDMTIEFLNRKRYTFKDTSTTNPYVSVKVVIADVQNYNSKLYGIAFSYE